MRVTEAVRDLARRLLAIEAGQSPSSDHASDAQARVCSKLRYHLVRVVGLEGFVALLSRALALAKVDAPYLAGYAVSSAGSLEGVPGATSPPGGEQAAEAYVTLLGHTIALLELFIGDGLTLGILYEIWPEAALSDTHLA